MQQLVRLFPFRNRYLDSHSGDVDGLFLIGLSWILGGARDHGCVAGWFESCFGFAPSCNAHTNLKATFSKRMGGLLESCKYGRLRIGPWPLAFSFSASLAEEGLTCNDHPAQFVTLLCS